MGIKALCAAAAVVVAGVGAADAAIYNYQFKVQFNGTSYDNVTLFPSDGSDSVFFDEVTTADNVYGIPELYDGLNVGDIVRMSITLFRPDDAEDWDNYNNGNGSYALSCRFGTVQCSTAGGYPTPVNWVEETDGRSIDFGHSDEHFYGGIMEVGGYIQHEFYPRSFDFFPTDTPYWAGNYERTYSLFSIVAPVPLPASAALLPLGIGALAFLRKRRRQVS